jgi:hypothetical protein
LDAAHPKDWAGGSTGEPLNQKEEKNDKKNLHLKELE